MSIELAALKGRAFISLADVMRSDQEGFKVRDCYFLELEHGLMGFFPAIFSKEPERVVLTTDQELLRKLWTTLSPRKSKMSTQRCLVHEGRKIAYPLHDNSTGENVKPRKLLLQDEYEKLTATGAKPFEWAPGLVGDDMTREEFLKTVELAAKHA